MRHGTYIASSYTVPSSTIPGYTCMKLKRAKNSHGDLSVALRHSFSRVCVKWFGSHSNIFRKLTSTIKRFHKWKINYFNLPINFSLRKSKRVVYSLEGYSLFFASRRTDEMESKCFRCVFPVRRLFTLYMSQAWADWGLEKHFRQACHVNRIW